MKSKNIGIIVVVGVLVVIGAAAWLLWPKGSGPGSSSSSYSAKDACSHLTQDVADAVLGAGASKGATPSTPTTSEDVSVSTCVYTSATDSTLESIRNIRSASLLIRAPLTSAGAESNKVPFNGKPNIDGYGQKAFWDENLGQLNVLVKDNWLIISAGKADMRERSLDEAKQLADKIVPKI